MGSLLVHNAEVDGRPVSVEIVDGRVVRMVDAHPGGRESVSAVHEVVDARGGALLPGLHDHHVHLLAAAAAMQSLELNEDTSVAYVLRNAPGDGELRVVGYHESLHGDLNRDVLDRIASDRPVRVQHRTGMLWVLNTAALRKLPSELPPGAERRADGTPNGRFLRADEWLREHRPRSVPHVTPVLDALRRRGVTGVTDMTPYSRYEELQTLADEVTRSSVAVTASGGPELVDARFPSPLRRGPVKIVLDEADLPPLGDAIDQIRAAHGAGRVVGVHCVTRSVLAFAVAAFDAAGVLHGDRIEHAAITPPDLRERLRWLGLTVVTQPALVRSRGEQYRTDVDADDLAHLWPCGSLHAAGIPVAGGTDAPFGPLDPWLAMDAAVDRRTSAGRVLGEGESVDAATALGMWLTPADDPGGAPRRVVVGSRARLCLLDRPLRVALEAPSDVEVVRTISG